MRNYMIVCISLVTIGTIAPIAICDEEGPIETLEEMGAYCERDANKTGMPVIEVLFGANMKTETWFKTTLPELKKLKHLKSIHLNSCMAIQDVTDEWLGGLASLPKLQKLDLQSCSKVTDEGIKKLTALTNLRELNISNTKISDMGLKNLSKLQEIQIMDLRKTQVTDEGLEDLAAMKNLRELWLSDTRVTIVGIAKLKKTLPDCEIHH